MALPTDASFNDSVVPCVSLRTEGGRLDAAGGLQAFNDSSSASCRSGLD